jgi:hypothetical protein
MARLPKLPKWPKGLKAKVRKAERLAERNKLIDARLKEIEAAKKKVAKI